jgi:RNA methyltransferase, TrmH family
MLVTSRDNSLLRRARAVRDGKDDDAIFVEGLRLCEEALSSGIQIETVIYSEEIAGKARASRLIESLVTAGVQTAAVSEKLLSSVSYTRTPQGIVLVARRPAHDESSFSAKQPRTPLIVVLHELNNPVNVGAILRAAEAAGVTGVMATLKTSDPFSPKSLRGAMGSAFRMPVWTDLTFARVIDWCRAAKIRAVCADASGSRLYTEVDWARSAALIVGPESEGLAPAELSAADESVRIPMQGATESLNVAVAAGIILFEAARQRAPK